jgi:hypothetical protein
LLSAGDDFGKPAKASTLVGEKAATAAITRGESLSMIQDMNPFAIFDGVDFKGRGAPPVGFNAYALTTLRLQVGLYRYNKQPGTNARKTEVQEFRVCCWMKTSFGAKIEMEEIGSNCIVHGNE